VALAQRVPVDLARLHKGRFGVVEIVHAFENPPQARQILRVLGVEHLAVNLALAVQGISLEARGLLELAQLHQHLGEIVRDLAQPGIVVAKALALAGVTNSYSNQHGADTPSWKQPSPPLLMLPVQQLLLPPGRPLQPLPPQEPHESAQHTAEGAS